MQDSIDDDQRRIWIFFVDREDFNLFYDQFGIWIDDRKDRFGFVIDRDVSDGVGVCLNKIVNVEFIQSINSPNQTVILFE